MSFRKIIHNLLSIIIFTAIFWVLIGFLFLYLDRNCQGLACGLGAIFVAPLIALTLGIVTGLYLQKIFFKKSSTVQSNQKQVGQAVLNMTLTFILIVGIIASNVGIITVMDSLGAFEPGHYWFPTALNPWLFGLMVIIDCIVVLYFHKKIEERP